MRKKLKKKKEIKKNKNIFSNFDQIIACMPGSVYWKDTNNIYQGCNNTLLDALGFTSMNQIIGKTDYDIGKILGIGIDVIEKFREVDQEVITTKLPKLNIEELPFHFGGGKIVNQITNKVPLRDENNNVVGLVGISIDISEQKKQEIDFLEQVFACMPGSVYWKDRKGVYLGCNNLLAELSGTLKSEIIGKTDYELGKKLHWPVNIAKWFEKIDQQVMNSGMPHLNFEELPFHFADGKIINQLSNKVPLHDKKGDVIGIVGVSIDITERKKMEKDLKRANEVAEAANKAKNEFLANMTHDVKTPLASIVGLSKLLTYNLSGENLNFAKNLLGTSQALLKFFNSCIELSKLECEGVSTHLKVFNFKCLLDEIFNLFQPAAKEKDLDFNINFDQKIPVSLLGNRANIYRVLLNLTGNAIKFTGQGSVTISAILNKESIDQKITIKLIVADTGLGIPQHKQEKIFERFTRLSSSYEGHGIGLYVVRKLLDAMSGSIHINSKEGKGSEFIVILPLQVPS